MAHNLKNSQTSCQVKGNGAALGRHILAEFFQCRQDLLNQTESIENAMCAAAIACGANIVESVFHTFNPYGVSGVVVIQESHLAIHTWPEYGYAAVDVFTCGNEIDPWVAAQYLKEALQAQEVNSIELKRGELRGYSVLQHKPTTVNEEKF
jgi:spermidine synthase